MQFILQSQIVGYHCDKLAIGGFSAIVLDSITKVGVKGIHVASVPRYLNGVADSALNAACRCLILLGDGGVEHLCNLTMSFSLWLIISYHLS